MKIITEKQIAEFIIRHPDAAPSLSHWLKTAKTTKWKSLFEIRKTYSSADEVSVASGRPVVIFNISGNNYRLITAVHYNKGCVYVMMFLTHAEYDKQAWKKIL